MNDKRLKAKETIHNLKMKLGLPLGDPLYTFPIRPPHVFGVTPQDIKKEFVEWLYTNISGEWKYIYDLGSVWGIGLYNETDAMAFKLRWMGNE